MNKREWMLHTVTAWYGRGYEMRERISAVGLAGELSQIYDAIVAASPEPTDEGWIEHRGEKPYPEGTVEICFRNGTTRRVDADGEVWTHDDNHPYDIIAWRPAT